jgi:IS30 family transposase
MYLYSAKHADATVNRRRSESRQGTRIGEEEKEALNALLTRLIRKGQPLAHIYAEHEDEIPVCLRSLYNYIDAGELAVRNIDLRRKTGYRSRKVKHPREVAVLTQSHGRPALAGTGHHRS